MKAKEIFEYLQSTNRQDQEAGKLGMTSFCKIHKMGFMDRTQLELLYKKVVKTSESQVMDLETFFLALEELGMKLLASD